MEITGGSPFTLPTKYVCFPPLVKIFKREIVVVEPLSENKERVYIYIITVFVVLLNVYYYHF